MPVPEAARIRSLDALRGFALLGILAVNIAAFSMPSAAYFNPTAWGDLTGLNRWVWQLTYLLADLKFMAIFSMLFGAGIVLMAERSEGRGASPRGVHYRRMAWLVVFGLLHGHLFWYGDILYWYGMCGLWVYLLRRVRPAWQIAWGLLLIAVASLIMLSAGLSLDRWPPEAVQEVAAQLDPPAEVKAAEVQTYRGGWLTQMDNRVPGAIEMQTTTFLAFAFWRVSGLMLLGMALFKLGVLTATRTRRFYWTLVAIAAAVGVPVIAAGIRWNFGIEWRAPEFFFLGIQFNYWASLLVSLGWVGLVMLACQAGWVPWLTVRLEAVGRTAFSNYILQTVICTTIFYGHGLGLYGQVERVGQAAIVVAIWILQLLISRPWLERFHYGPLEWLWRTLTYLQRPAFRRVPASR